MGAVIAKQEIKKALFAIYEISEDYIRHEGREYNAYEWERIINRYAALQAKFYKVDPQDGVSYIRYYAVYKSSDGLTLFHSVSYTSMLSSNGFVEITIENGVAYRHLIDCSGKYGRAGNTPQSRAAMAWHSAMSEKGKIYSNEF